MALDTLEPIRVAAGGRYFETSSGQPFLFIGANDALSWPGLAGLYERRDTAQVEQYLAEYAAHGVTIVRLMLEYAHDDHYYFETTPGVFNPRVVQVWDDLFALCGQFGLRVLLTPWDTFWMARRWQAHPYNVANGGPCPRPEEFLSTPAVLTCMEQRLQFVIERWGGNGVLAAWDLFNELHPYWGGSVAEQSSLITHLSHIIRELEERTWGPVRPQTVSAYGPAPDAELATLIFEHPALDFATTHIYHHEAIDNPPNTIAPALSMAQWVHYALERTPVTRPFTDSEHGPIHLFNDQQRWLDEAFDNEYERHLMWAHLASGGAGSGLRWPSRHPHVLTAGMKQALAHMAAFVPLLEWRTFTPQPIHSMLTLDHPHVLALGSYDRHQALIWLVRDDPARQQGCCLPAPSAQLQVQLQLRGLEPAVYTIHAWDTRKGQLIQTFRATVTEDQQLALHVPLDGNDLALAVTQAYR